MKRRLGRATFVAALAVASAGCWDWSSPHDNLVVNPGCETDIEGWGAYQGTVRRTTGVARTGVASCEAVLGDGFDDYTIDDSPPYFEAPPEGAVFWGSVWVRSDTATGKPAAMHLRAYSGGTAVINGSSETVMLSTEWQQLTATLEIDRPDIDWADIYVGQWMGTAGDTFQTDDFVVVRVK